MDSLPCPSFNVYASSDNNTSISIADIADRVTKESRDDHSLRAHSSLRKGEDAGGDDFEFVTIGKHSDEVDFEGGYVGPVYPVFHRDLFVDFQSNETKKCNEDSALEDDEKVASLQISLRNLFINEEDGRHRDIDPESSSSSSSSEVGDLDSVPPGSYCVWSPASAKALPSSCKKSKSTGSSSSKRWKLLDLLRRSNSDGKDNLIFLSPSPLTSKKMEKSRNSKEPCSSSSASVEFSTVDEATGRSKTKSSPTVEGSRDCMMSAHEVLYVRNRALKEEDKRRSYLPYRQDLVGFFRKQN